MESCCGSASDIHVAALTIWAAMGIGLTTSLGHCIGMCGPLVSTFSLAQGRHDGRLRALLPALLIYHFGRLNAYAVIGVAFGLLATAAQATGPSNTVRGTLFLIAGALMVVMGMGLRGWVPTGRIIESSRLGRFTGEKFMGLVGTSSLAGRYFLGVANGFLPCGPVYAMAIAALTAPTPLHGAGTMVAFGLGTMPVLVAIGLGAGRLAPALQRKFNLVASLLVIFVGIEFLLRSGKMFGIVAGIKWGFWPVF